MSFSCPKCGGPIDAASLEGAARCDHCGSVLYLEQGAGLPHRMVASPRGEDEIRRAASDCLRRAGVRPTAGGSVTLYYIPYYVTEDEGAARTFTGYTAVSLPVPALARIPIFGSDTRWFDRSATAPRARILEPALSPSEAASGRAVLELRHVAVAHVLHEAWGGLREPVSLWIEAERCRVLAGEPCPPARPHSAPGLRGWVAAACGAALVPGLVLPLPWSLLAAGAVLVALQRAGKARFGA